MTTCFIASIHPVYTSGCGLAIHGNGSTMFVPCSRYGGIVDRIDAFKSIAPNTVDTRPMISARPTVEPHAGVAHSTGHPDHACTGGGPTLGYMTWVLPNPSDDVGPTDCGGVFGPGPFAFGSKLRGSSAGINDR